MDIYFRVPRFKVMYLFFRGEIYHRIVGLCSIGILLSIRVHMPMGSLRCESILIHPRIMLYTVYNELCSAYYIQCVV